MTTITATYSNGDTITWQDGAVTSDPPDCMGWLERPLVAYGLPTPEGPSLPARSNAASRRAMSTVGGHASAGA